MDGGVYAAACVVIVHQHPPWLNGLEEKPALHTADAHLTERAITARRGPPHAHAMSNMSHAKNT